MAFSRDIYKLVPGYTAAYNASALEHFVETYSTTKPRGVLSDLRFRFVEDGARSGEWAASCDPLIVRCFW